MASKININLDTSKENYLVAKCKQNDDLTLEASIFENGLALDLTNKTITIQALKSDNTYIIQNTDIVKENNKINAELDRDFSRVPGTTKIEIVLVESSKQNTTFSFYLEVVGSVIRGAVQSSNTATILEALDNKIVEAGVVKEETEQLIESGGAAKKEDIININASLEQIVQYSVKDFICDDGILVKGDGVHDDITGIQKAINLATLSGGIIRFPKGIYNISKSIEINTSNVGKALVIEGHGLGVTNIRTTTDVSCFNCQGYLYEIRDLSINTTINNSTKPALYLEGGGRRKLKNLQVSRYFNGLSQEGFFDQFEIDSCNFNNSIGDGVIINVNNNGSCALFRMQNSLCNNNGGCGFKLIQTLGQIINFKMDNVEIIDNVKDGFYAESTYGQPITGITLDSCDIEGIKDGYNAITLNKVYKFAIKNCAFNDLSTNINSVINLMGCKDGIIETPWLPDDATRHKVLVDSLCDTIFLKGARISFATKFSFTTKSGLVPLTCINLDENIEKSKKYYMDKRFNNELLEEVFVNNIYGFKMKHDKQYGIRIPYDGKRVCNMIKIVWANISDDTNGNVSFNTFNISLEGKTTVYSGKTDIVGGKNVLKTTEITVGDLTLDSSNGFTVFKILRDSTNVNDTFTGDICIVSVEFMYKNV